jgi:TolB-like protein/DNA-binding winged helix-turn-helix (wHTH) protein
VLDQNELASTGGADPGVRNLPRLSTVPEDTESTSVGSYLYRFGQFVLDPRRRTLSRDDSPVFLTPKAFDVLIFLVRNPNRLVTKEELLQSVWGDTFVEEGNLTQYISHLRKGLRDSEGTRLIVTIARKGYQFTGDVAVVEVSDIAKHTRLYVPATRRSRVNKQQVEFSTEDTVPRAPACWRKTTVVRVSAVILVVAGYTFWRHSREISPPKSGKIMLAVLPFENLTGDPNKEYLADGLTEETISQLSRLNPEQLGVIARTSVMGYKHKDERLDRVGHDLSVQYVLENSLRESGGHIRITAQLIQVSDQTHVWSQDYDYSAKDILSVEDDVSQAVAHEIRLRLTSQPQAEVARSRPVNPEAFDAYLQGHYFFERDTDKDTDMAARYFERATQLDPSYAMAWVGLSRARNWQAVRGLIPSEEGHRFAREAVERALTLNPNLAEAHTQMARIKRQVDFDWAGADASIQRAMALDPGDPENVGSAAFSAAMVGRLDEALQLARREVNLDPLNAFSWENLGETKCLMGQLDEAAADFKKAIELRSDFGPSHIWLRLTYIMQGRPQDALPEIDRVQGDDIRLYLYALAYHALGRKKESDAALRELIAKYHAIDAYQIAEVYAFGNQSDEAFEWLDRAYAQHDDGLIGTKVDPLLKSLHADPRYAALLKKLHLPH